MVDVSGISTLGTDLKATAKNKKKDFESQMQEQATFMAKVVSSLSSDPMNPLKPQDTMKLFQDLTNSQQLMRQTELLEGLSKKMEMGQLLTASSLSGKLIEVQDDRFQVGAINLQYHLPEEIDGAFVDILNEQGNVVRSLQVTPEKGIHSLAFDQRDSQGRRLDPGTYAYRARYIEKGNLEAEKLFAPKPFTIREQSQQASYMLPKSAKQCTLTLETDKGQVVHRWNGSLEQGKHGLDVFEAFKQAGVALPEGAYRFRAYAVDHQDKPIETQTLMHVQVEGVEMGEKGPAFRYQGGLSTPFERYRALKEQTEDSLNVQLDSILQKNLHKKLEAI
ncbi:MAG: FlgD immunoglobulin-like domain containing protein [Alphaproteobacteria bacterium]